jgi:hypothetical protein
MGFTAHCHQRYPSFDDLCATDSVERIRLAKIVVISCRPASGKHFGTTLDWEASCIAMESVVRGEIITATLFSQPGIPSLRNRARPSPRG